MATKKKPKLITVYPTVAQHYSAFLIMNIITGKELYGKLSIKLRRLKREVKPLAVEFEEERGVMLEACGVKDGEDWKKTPEEDGYVWKTKKAEAAFNEMKDTIQPVSIVPLVDADFDRDDVQVAEKLLEQLEECFYYFPEMPEKSPGKPKVEPKAKKSEAEDG